MLSLLCNQESPPVSLPDELNTCNVLAGLARLLGEFKCAQALGLSAWDFPVALALLHQTGLTGQTLRTLITEEYVEHRIETTRPQAKRRRFRQPRGQGWNWRSHFVLTARGESIASSLLFGQENSLRTVIPDPAIPYWNAGVRELRYQGGLIKRFRRPAPNQEYILTSLQELGWPLRMDDPIPPDAEVDAFERLRETVKSLNRGQNPHLLRFVVQTGGRAIHWQKASWDSEMSPAKS